MILPEKTVERTRTPEFEPDDLLVSTIMNGMPGSGKSKRVEKKLVHVIEEGIADLVVLMDSEEKTARDTALQLIGRGLEKCIIWDNLRSFDRVLGGLSPQQSIDPNAFRRESENRLRLDTWKRTIWVASDRVEENGKDLFGMPGLNMAAEMASRILFYQKDPAKRNFAKFPVMVQVGSLKCRELVAGIDPTIPDARRAHAWYAEVVHLYDRANYRLLEEKIGALERLIEQAFTPQFRERLGGEFIIPTLLEEKRVRPVIIIINGADDGSVPSRSVTAVFRAWNEKLYQALQHHFIRTGRPARVIVVWEEMAANNILGVREIVMLRKGRKVGFHPWGLTQDFAFADPQTREAMTKLFRRKEWFNPGDAEMAKWAGEDLAYRALDAYRLHSSEFSTKQLRRDRPRSESRITRTESSDGETTRLGSSEVLVDVFDYDTIREEHKRYFALDDQIKLKVGETLTLGTGEFMVSHMTEHKQYVSHKPEYSAMLPEEFNEEEEPGLGDKKLAQVIARSQASAYFRTPVVSEPPCPPPPPAPKPARTGSANRVRGRRAGPPSSTNGSNGSKGH